MNWTIRLFWNGTECLSGQSTAVCAVDTAYAHFAGNFAGVEFKRWLAKELDGAAMLRAVQGNFHVTKQWRDASGEASAHISPIIAR